MIWSGNLKFSGTISVSGISKHKIFYVKTSISDSVLFPVEYVNGTSNSMFGGAYGISMNFRTIAGNISISDDSLTFSNLIFAQYVYQNLGSAPICNAGDHYSITAIYV